MHLRKNALVIIQVGTYTYTLLTKYSVDIVVTIIKICVDISNFSINTL